MLDNEATRWNRRFDIRGTQLIAQGGSPVNDENHHYWQTLNRQLVFVLNELLYLPTCCAHLLNGGDDIRQALKKHSHRPEEMEHRCRSCGEDIVSRAQTPESHRSVVTGQGSFHQWMQNDEDHLTVYGDTPQATGFEASLPGFADGHLQRVEQYWYDHQLVSPMCGAKATTTGSCCVPAEDWHKTVENTEEEKQ